MKQKEGAREQDTGETERERVQERGRIVANWGSIGCKNGRWRNIPLGISQDHNKRIILIAGNYFNDRYRGLRL